MHSRVLKTVNDRIGRQEMHLNGVRVTITRLWGINKDVLKIYKVETSVITVKLTSESFLTISFLVQSHSLDSLYISKMDSFETILSDL